MLQPRRLRGQLSPDVTWGSALRKAKLTLAGRYGCPEIPNNFEQGVPHFHSDPGPREYTAGFVPT